MWINIDTILIVAFWILISFPLTWVGIDLVQQRTLFRMLQFSLFLLALLFAVQISINLYCK